MKWNSETNALADSGGTTPQSDELFYSLVVSLCVSVPLWLV